MTHRVSVQGTVWIPKTMLRNNELATLSRELQVVNGFSGVSIPTYHETDEHVAVPKFWFARTLLPRLKPFLVNNEYRGERRPWRFAGELRSHQRAPRTGFVPVPTIVDTLLKYRGVFASAPCGSGKTVSALYILAHLGVPTLVITPTETIRKQWVAQARRFVPDAHVTEYSGKRKNLQGDIVVASLQLLMREPISRAFGLVIVDESHLASAPMFSRAIYHINFRFSLALTATGDRFDGLRPVFERPLAQISIELDTDQMPLSVILKPTNLTHFDTNWLVRFDSMKVDHRLASIEHRNTCLVQWIINAYQNGRNIMVLGKEILQLQILRDVFMHCVPEARTAMFIGESKNTVRRSAQQRETDERYKDDPRAVMFSTLLKGGVGYDNVEKDCLILTTAVFDPRQLFGRVQRQSPGKNRPICIIPVDPLPQIHNRVCGAFKRAMLPLGGQVRVINKVSGLVNRLTALENNYRQAQQKKRTIQRAHTPG